MNKRIKKKKLKNYHKRFCNDGIEDYNCPKCSWDSIDADDYLELAKNVVKYPDGSFEVKYNCPICNTEFEYWDSIY